MAIKNKIKNKNSKKIHKNIVTITAYEKRF